MNTLDFIKQHLTNKTVVHAAMLAFAVTSTLNIAGFFVATHHSAVVAASAGLALGAGLMAVSIYLSKQEFGKGLSFWTMLASTVAMAILSGQIQSMAYQLHGLDTFTSRLLGFAPPFVAEVLLALSVSLAERTERERAQRDSKQFIKDSVAESMTSAFRNVDASRIQKHIEKQVDGVIRAFVDDALGEMMAELSDGRAGHLPAPAPMIEQVITVPTVIENTPQIDAETPVENAPQIEHITNISEDPRNVQPDAEQTFAERMAAAKAAKKAQRQNELLAILMTEFNGQPSDALNKSALGDRLGVKHTTIGRDIEELIAANRLAVNGHIEVFAEVL